MRFAKPLSMIAGVALVAACSSNPPSRSEQFGFLRDKGVVVDESKVTVTSDGRWNFPLGVCNAEFFYSEGRAYLYVYHRLAYPIEQFQGDSIRDAGKTASTMFCLQEEKEPRPSESK